MKKLRAGKQSSGSEDEQRSLKTSQKLSEQSLNQNWMQRFGADLEMENLTLVDMIEE